jgi:hypothetical protein
VQFRERLWGGDTAALNRPVKFCCCVSGGEQRARDGVGDLR